MLEKGTVGYLKGDAKENIVAIGVIDETDPDMPYRFTYLEEIGNLGYPRPGWQHYSSFVPFDGQSYNPYCFSDD